MDKFPIVPEFTLSAGCAVYDPILTLWFFFVAPSFFDFSQNKKQSEHKMYPTLLALHSLVRWLVLTSLLFAIFRAYNGWLANRSFSRVDNSVRHWTATITHVQLILGLWLYFISPVIDYFLHNYKDAVHQREIRFFGMEHSLMMITAIIIITIGSAKAKRKQTDNEKFKTMAIWFTLGLLILLTSIPWSFSPFASRPNFRPF